MKNKEKNELLAQIEYLQEELRRLKKREDRFYSFILGLKNLIEAMPEFNWELD